MLFSGEKDFQQLAIIKRMVADLNIATKVIGMPIVRESDGLAMSSRNAYLKNEERESALALYKALESIRKQVRRGPELSLDEIVKEAEQSIATHEQCSVDYLTVVDSESLEKIDEY